MSADPELLRLRAVAQDAEDRYFRLKLLLSDSAAVEAAHAIWSEAEGGVQLYEAKLAGGRSTLEAGSVALPT